MATAAASPTAEPSRAARAVMREHTARPRRIRRLGARSPARKICSIYIDIDIDIFLCIYMILMTYI